MGIFGLSTYIREHRRTLAQTHQLKNSSQQPVSYRPIVVDGWSFIYHLQNHSSLPWVYGGEYDQLADLTIRVIQHWIAFGLAVHFVFDGPIPQLKFPTQVSRSTELVQSAILFYRTSPASRSTPRFLRETQIIPPLCFSACRSALEILASSEDNLHVHYADAEADPYVVDLAGRIGACVLGMDSDFMVLNTAGYKGYIPLDEMVWTASVPEDKPSDDMDGEFFTVKKGKGKARTSAPGPSVPKVFGQGVIPPQGVDKSDLRLSITVYKPELLAAHLRLPQSLLPLLGALAGNDYSKEVVKSRNVRNMFFERSMTPSQRIDHAAEAVRTVLVSAQKKSKAAVDSVTDLIDKTVRTLLSRTIQVLGSGEVAEVVEKIIEATLQYAMQPTDVGQPLWQSRVCALHTPETCPLFPYFSRRLISEGSAEDRTLIKSRKLYTNAYRKGNFHPRLVDVLVTGTFWPRIFLENPDAESTACSVGRPIMVWVYSILEDALGLPEPSLEEEEDDRGSEEDQEELVDVMEEDSDDDDDLLAPLRGALQKLRSEDGAESDDSEIIGSIDGSSHISMTSYREVTEYVRRGSHISAERVPVQTLPKLLVKNGIDVETYSPLAPVQVRLGVFLAALKADTPEIRSLPPEYIVPAVVVRWVIRVSGNQSGAWVKERWTRRETAAMLAALSPSASSEDDAESHRDTPPVTDRNVHLVGQVLTALSAIECLVDALLLADLLQHSVVGLSGSRLHVFLSQTEQRQQSLFEGLFEACSTGMDRFFREDAASASRKKKKQKKLDSSPGTPFGENGRTGGAVPARGLFELLANAEA